MNEAEALALLRPVERFWYRIADAVERHAPAAQICWNQLFMVNMVRLLGMRRVRLEGVEHLDSFGADSSVVLVANHRSFFDFFVIGAVLYTRTGLPKRILFPVRAPFFYDHPLGGVVNAIMSAFTMFPPIMRDKERGGFNRFAVERTLEAMRRPGQLMGFHPEGTRSKGADPYTMLRAQPGVGRIVLDAPESRIVPIMIVGLSNSMWTELVRNWTAPQDWPLDIWIGDEVDVGGVPARPERQNTPHPLL